jgi:hypothetical protein
VFPGHGLDSIRGLLPPPPPCRASLHLFSMI